MTRGPARAACGACIIGLALVAPPAAAQRAAAARPRPRPEARLDAMVARRGSAIHAGAGLEQPVGRYARLAGVLGAGAVVGGGPPVFSARAEALTRFVLDPLAEQPRSPYAAAGVSVRRERAATRAHLVALLGVQLRPRRGYVPSVELGFGGGVRLGVVLRRAR